VLQRVFLSLSPSTRPISLYAPDLSLYMPAACQADIFPTTKDKIKN
jgi:hypothetical protein